MFFLADSRNVDEKYLGLINALKCYDQNCEILLKINYAERNINIPCIYLFIPGYFILKLCLFMKS